MSKKNIYQKQKSWSEYYEDRLLTNQLRKNKKPRSEDSQRFILESRFQLMEDSLNKTKVGSEEFNALLEECINIYTELHEDKHLDKNVLLRLTKDRLLKKEIVGEFDKTKPKDDKEWPLNGRITLRDAIISDSGRHSDKDEEKRIKSVFAPDELDKDSPSKVNKK